MWMHVNREGTHANNDMCDISSSQKSVCVCVCVREHGTHDYMHDL